MNHRTVLSLIMALTIGAASLPPAHAQSAIGGATRKQNYVGGPTTHPNPVMPSPKGTTTPNPMTKTSNAASAKKK